MAPRASSLLPPLSRRQLQRIVLEADTRGGRLYNLIIFATILLSVAGFCLSRYRNPLAVSCNREALSFGSTSSACWFSG